MTEKESKKSFYKQASPERASALLIHGLTANPSELKSLALKLHLSGISVYLPLLSGHGKGVEELRKVTSINWINDSRDALKKVIEDDKSGNIFIVGMSFGSLLSLTATENFLPDGSELSERGISENQKSLKGVVLLSSPFSLRSSYKKFFLKLFSYFPDFLLNLLWTVKKKGGREGRFSLKRVSMKRHSIAAAARLYQIRRKAKAALVKLKVPLLAIQDPEDHHLLPKSLEEVKSHYGGDDLNAVFLEGAEHELTLGPKYEEVEEIVLEFLNKRIS